MSAKKMYAWLDDRSAGILLHPSSLPGNHGIGTLGQTARAFIDFLAQAGIQYWQTLPLGPTGFGDSPYSSLSSFAGNPFLIDLEPLANNGILDGDEANTLLGLSRERADFAALRRIKLPLLRLSHKKFTQQGRNYLPNYGRYADFKEANHQWLEPFCAYMGLKERFGGAFWGDWPEECRSLESARNSNFWGETAYGRELNAFFQYLFFGQWKQIREYAKENSVQIIGDIPIFVALDSADAWANPGIFQMSGRGEPQFVAGVPPDYFSETGQLWGNPLYDWDVLKSGGYRWWIDRLKANFALYDVVRLDHFRAFYDYWRIPAGSEDATRGKWMPGPQDDFFKAVKKAIPSGRIIAEDLGEIHKKVFLMRDRLGLPGMSILHFAFEGDPTNLYLPHNLVPNSVLYPGTHDNDTTRGWYDKASEETRDFARHYLRVDGHDIAWDMIRCAYQSVSNLVIFQMQDLMSLGTQARMNIPGTSQGNWSWRMTGEQFAAHQQSAGYLRHLGRIYDRC